MIERYCSCSIVVPVYNSADCLPGLIEVLAGVLPGLCSKYEVILVNDGSPDDSWECIEQLSRDHSWVRGINLMRNYGQHNALLAGIRQAQFEIIVTMDDDLQHPPQEIWKLLKKLDEGYDVVYACPKKLPHSIWRNLTSFFSKRALSYVMGISTVRDIGSFRAFRASLCKAFYSYQNPNVLIDVLLSWGTTRFATVPVDQSPRQIGKSNYGLIKLIRTALVILTGFSTLPLRFTSLVGFGVTLFGVGVLAYVVLLSFLEGSIPGFPFLASIISIFSGTQLFALGIIGEYLARVFDRSMERPPYVINQMTTQAESLPGEPSQL